MQANVLDCGRFGGEEGFNDNAKGFVLIVQRRGAGAGQVGGRSAKTEEPKRMDRRFGVRMGVMEGGLFSAIKNSKKRALAWAFIRWRLCCFPWGLQWELGDYCSAEAH